MIINYDFPEVEDYQKNFGFPSRFVTTKPKAITFVTPNDRESLKKIESAYSIEIRNAPVDVNFWREGEFINEYFFSFRNFKKIKLAPLRVVEEEESSFIYGSAS